VVGTKVIDNLEVRERSKSHIVVREATRNFHTWQAYVSQTGVHVLRGETTDRGVIEMHFYDVQRIVSAYTPDGWKHGYPQFPEDDPFKLSERKKEAVYYNVIQDLKQKDVAEIMGITTVSVGQYVESGFLQITNHLFGPEDGPLR